MRHFPSKYTGCYRCPDPVNNLKIRIRLQETEIADGLLKDEWHEKALKWQEKRFSKAEMEKYTNLDNCPSDLDKKYHQLVTNLTETEDFIFTYTDEDGYENDRLGLPIEKPREKQTQCQENCQKWHLMADFQDNIKLLCFLEYHKDNRLLKVFPDFTKTRPYLIKVPAESTKYWYLFIDNISETLSEGILLKEQLLFKKIIKNYTSVRDGLVGNKFEVPTKDKEHYHLFFDLQKAQGFEYHEIYVKYHIVLPKNWSTKSTSGTTHLGYGKIVHFNYHFDILLEHQCLVKDTMEQPTIYFEVISKDMWDISRIEGLTFKVLPLHQSENMDMELQCFRFGANSVVQDLRRFFLGDYNHLVTQIGPSFDNKVLNRVNLNTIGTGTLSLKVHVIRQTTFNINNNERKVKDKMTDCSLIKTVEDVLQAFQKARSDMLEARKTL